MRRPASPCMYTRRPGGARATPPIRHYERIVRMHPPKPEDTAASGNVRRRRPGGLGANKPPRWSAERRASPGAQTVKASLRGDARGLREWPAHKTGADAPERLSALRFPLFVRGKDCKPRRSSASREG